LVVQRLPAAAKRRRRGDAFTGGAVTRDVEDEQDQVRAHGCSDGCRHAGVQAVDHAAAQPGAAEARASETAKPVVFVVPEADRGQEDPEADGRGNR
jgi:hypothetical protein